MVTKFWNSFSGEQSVWDSMQYATDNGAHITTASLGWPHSLNPDRVTWRMVCENTIAAGLVVLYAAGNEGCGNPPDNVRTPGDVPSVLSIGATDCNDVIAGFSSCGPITWQGILPYDDCPYPPGCLKPTVSAPGVSTISCDNLPCTGYTTKSGTSMATPWHQDRPYYFVDGHQTVSFWVPLDPVDTATLRCVAGSHLWEKEVLPTRWVSEADFFPDEGQYMAVPDPDSEGMHVVEFPMQPGDAVAFDFRTLHGARGNDSPNRRRAFSLRLVGDDARYVERPGPTSPPFPGHDMVAGQRLREDWFPILHGG